MINCQNKCIRCGSTTMTLSHLGTGFCEDCLIELKELESSSSDSSICVHLSKGLKKDTHSDVFYFSHQIRFANLRVGICSKHLEEGLTWFEQQRIAERERHAAKQRLAVANKGGQLTLW